MNLNSGILSWNIDEISNALKISVNDVKEYFTDGRRISFIIERRLVNEVLLGKLAPSEGSFYDVEDKNSGKWEVRSITNQGIYFCPSYMVGSGRAFDEKGFLEKMDLIEGYIVSDIESFPDVPFWFIPKIVVEKWWSESKLGTTTKISRTKALQLIEILYS